MKTHQLTLLVSGLADKFPIASDAASSWKMVEKSVTGRGWMVEGAVVAW